MLGFSFRGSRVSEFLSGRVKMLYPTTASRSSRSYARALAGEKCRAELKLEKIPIRPTRVVRRQGHGSRAIRRGLRPKIASAAAAARRGPRWTWRGLRLY